MPPISRREPQRFRILPQSPAMEGAVKSDRPRGQAAEMTIRHERPSPDTAFRVTAPLLIALADGSVAHVRHWSLRAVHSVDLAGRDPADLAGASLIVPFQGINIYFPVTLVPGEGRDEFLLVGLNGRQRETLGLFYRNLLSGRMVAVGDIITALDAPVDLVPMEETEAERAAAEGPDGPRRRRRRAMFYIAAYLLAAVLLVGYLGSLVYGRLDTLTLSAARVVAETVALRAPVAGEVAELAVPEGVEVAAGEVLLRLEAPETRREAERLAAAVARAEAALADVAERIAVHAAGREAARSAAAAAAEGAAAFERGVPLAPGDYHDIRLRLEAEARERSRELRLLEAEAARLQGELSRLEIRAPAAGRVAAFAALPGQTVAAGTPLLTFETGDLPEVEGFLPDSLAAEVWVGMPGRIRLSRAGEELSLEARVAALLADPATAGAARPLMRVRLEPLGLAPAEARALLPAEAPVRATLALGLWRGWLGLPRPGE